MHQHHSLPILIDALSESEQAKQGEHSAEPKKELMKFLNQNQIQTYQTQIKRFIAGYSWGTGSGEDRAKVITKKTQQSSRSKWK